MSGEHGVAEGTSATRDDSPPGPGGAERDAPPGWVLRPDTGGRRGSKKRRRGPARGRGPVEVGPQFPRCDIFSLQDRRHAGPETVELDDLVVLGNAVPSRIKDGRKTVCFAGYSKKEGLIRVYPARPDSPVGRWNRLGLSLVRNRQDTRAESWKVQGSSDEWDTLSERIRMHGSLGEKGQKALWYDLCDKYGVGCVKDLNEGRRSLGIVRPTVISHRFVERDRGDRAAQSILFPETSYKTIKDYGLKPVIKYRCSECKAERPHEQQVLEWGVYEWLRNNHGKEEQVWENLHLDDPGWDKWFLVGNQARYRNSFVIVGVVRFKGADPGQSRLFD